MYFAATFIASLAITAHTLATPALRHRQQHSAIAKVRALGSERVVPLEQEAANVSVPKKQLRKRCKPRKKQSLIPSSTQTSSVAPSPSGSGVPVNVGSNPSSSSAAAHSPDPSPSPKPSPQPTPQPPPPAQSPPPPPPPPSSTPQSPPPSSPSGGGSEVFTGQGTFFEPGLGACGMVNSEKDFIVAVSEKLFDVFPGYNGVNPNQNPICGRKIVATFQGKSVTVTVTDRCVACDTHDLDFSPSAFSQLADQSVGRLFGMRWVLA